MTSKLKLIGPLTGILFVALVISSFIVSGDTPVVDDSSEEVVSYYTDHATRQQWAAALLALGCVALLFFLGKLRQTLRAAAGSDSWLSTVVLLGGLMIAAGASIFAGITFTLGDTVDNLPADAVVTLNALNMDLFFPLAVGVAAFNLGLGLTVIQHGGLPRLLGWLALIVGIAALTPIGFFAFLATGIVIVWASVALLMRATERTPVLAKSKDQYGLAKD